jgi:hypothetical protein
MAKTQVSRSMREGVLVVILLVTSIVVTNSLIIFSSNEDNRFYISGVISTVAIGSASIISIIMVFRYKRHIKNLENKTQQALYPRRIDTKPQLRQYYFDDNKMHISICLFLIFWFAAAVIWTFENDQSADILIADAFYYIGYASFGYFLYSLYYRFFRKEFEPLILILVAVIILIPLIFVVDTIVSTLRLLSNQKVDLWVVVKNAAYPILDSILIFPTVIMYWGAKRIGSRIKRTKMDEQEIGQLTGKQENSPSPSYYLISNCAPLWMFLLFVGILLSAAGDTGFAYTSAFDITTVQNYVWIWNIFYNSDHLCFAAALIGYRHFFGFVKANELWH